MKVIPSLSI